MKRTTALIAALTLSSTVHAAGTPEQKCQGGKNETAGKLSACLAKAEKKFVLTGDGTVYGEAVTKCGEKFSSKWQKLEESAVAASTTCPTTADETAIHDFVESCEQAVASALAGSPLVADPVTCDASLTSCNANYSMCAGNLTTCNNNFMMCSGSLSTCNAGTATAADVLAGKTFSSSAGVGVAGTATAGSNVSGADGSASFTIPDGFYSGSKTCTASDSDLTAGNIKRGTTILGVTGTLGLPKSGQTTSYGAGSDGVVQAGSALSYTDNGDGTVTDNVTGLMWEKKDDSGGIHDKDTFYTWGMTSAPYTMNGTMVTTFLAALNTMPCFAGYCDWRIPNAKELQSIVDYEIPFPGPTVNAALHKPATCTGCMDVTAAACSCTVSGVYWSSATYLGNPGNAWNVNFTAGNVNASTKTTGYQVRAVRGGL